jgi:hypothetical protein
LPLPLLRQQQVACLLAAQMMTASLLCHAKLACC